MARAERASSNPAAARKLLGKLASGDAGVVLTAEARSALGRLKAGK